MVNNQIAQSGLWSLSSTGQEKARFIEARPQHSAKPAEDLGF
jgi:hypothetical protein